MKRLYSSILLLIAVSFSYVSLADDAKEVEAKSAKVLFVGNSYTYWVEDVLNFILSNSEYGDSKFDFHTRGATPLAYFAEDDELSVKIKNGDFDYVVFQEWSAGVGNNEESTKSFEESLFRLAKLSRDAGSEPLLYMTWGREGVDGYEGFSDMSERVAAGYLAAGKANSIPVIPVGKIWQDVRTKNEVLGQGLYEDGTHPSIKGQVLITAAFMRAIYSDPLEWGSAFSSYMTEEEWLLIKGSVEKHISLNFLK